MKKSFKLLNQIIEKAELEDLEHKKNMIKNHKSSQAVGESWMLFQLKILKQTLEKELNGQK